MKKHFKKSLALILSLIMLITSVTLTASAETEKQGYYTYTVTDGKATITDVDTFISGDIIIPSTLGGYPVTTIDCAVFSGCNLTSITIPKGVTSIGEEVFRDCTNLEKINLPDGLTTINAGAFVGCESLTSISIPESVTDMGPWTFNNCISLKRIIIPEGVTGISNAFQNCISLESIMIKNPECSIFDFEYTIYSGATIYGYKGSTAQAYAEKYNRNFVDIETHMLNALSYKINNAEVTITECDTSFTGAMIIPEAIEGYPVKTIGYGAFEKCVGITEVEIPNTVTKIDDNAFYDCFGIKEITIPANVTYLGVFLFHRCESLEDITIPDNVTTISDSTFAGCINLKEVIIPDKVTKIAQFAFAGCNSITKISIPGNVMSIGENAFNQCDGLEIITINNPECVIYESQDSIFSGATICGYEGSPAQAYAEKYTRNFVDILDCLNALRYEIKNGEVTITDCDTSFTGTMVIPDTIEGYQVKTIGYNAFKECVGITEVEIPDSVIFIYSWAFAYCSNLKNVTIGNGVTTIGERAFSDCYSLEGVNIGNSVAIIVFYAFTDCYSLKNITIPANITSIGEGVFWNCNSLESISVDENNMYYTSDEYGVLFNDDKTELIQYPIGNSRIEYLIPDNVTTIGLYAFGDCSCLENVIIPDSVTLISGGAFAECNNLKMITIPHSTTSISDWVFDGCTCLTSITVDANNMYYSSDEYGVLFNKNKTSLLKYPVGNGRTDYIIPDSVIYIEDEAFEYSENLRTITIGNSVATVGERAFAYCENLTEITIPKHVTKIDYNALKNCINLESVTICNPECSINSSADTIDSSATIYGYCGSTAQKYAEKYARNFESEQHDYAAVVTAPTCTEQGFTTYTCKCDDSYIADFTEIVDHTDNDGDDYCDFCGVGTAEEESGKNCSCMCHKEYGFVGFFWKILRFLYRLFGTNPLCECGMVHY